MTGVQTCALPILMESAEWIYQDGKFEQVADQSKSIIKKATSINLEEQQILAFQHFLRNIK